MPLYLTVSLMTCQISRGIGKHNIPCVGRVFKRWLSVPSLPIRQLPTNYDMDKRTPAKYIRLCPLGKIGFCSLKRVTIREKTKDQTE